MNQLFQVKDFQTHWQSLTEEERKTLVHSIMEQAGKAVRMFYLCRKILSEAHIKITAQDLKMPARTPLEILSNPEGAISTHHQPELKEAEVYSRLILEKAEDYIIEQVTKNGNLL